jgi:uncharacterized membrane protein
MNAFAPNASPSDILLKLIPLAILFFLVDIPWLYGIGDWAAAVFQKVQGGLPLRFNLLAAVPVYFFLAYLLLHTTSRLSAFLMGVAVYGVYDFTNLATLAKYEPAFAIADTLWGGVLFTVVYTLRQALGL